MISSHLIQPRSTRLGMVLTTVGWDLPQLSIKTIQTRPIWWRQFFSWCPQVALDCLKLTMNLKSTSEHWLLVVLRAGVQGQSSGRFYIWESHGHLLHYVGSLGRDRYCGPHSRRNGRRLILASSPFIRHGSLVRLEPSWPNHLLKTPFLLLWIWELNTNMNFGGRQIPKSYIKPPLRNSL